MLVLMRMKARLFKYYGSKAIEEQHSLLLVPYMLPRLQMPERTPFTINVHRHSRAIGG